MYFATLPVQNSEVNTIVKTLFISTVLLQAVVLILRVLPINLKNLYPLTDRPAAFSVLTWRYFFIFLSSVGVLYY